MYGTAIENEGSNSPGKGKEALMENLQGMPADSRAAEPADSCLAQVIP